MSVSVEQSGNKEFGAFNSNNLNLDTDNAKVHRVLTIFIAKNIIYTDIERRSNTINNRSAAGTNQNNPAAVIKTGKNDNLSSNYRFDNLDKVSHLL